MTISAFCLGKIKKPYQAKMLTSAQYVNAQILAEFPLITSPTKNLKPKTKNYFLLQTRRLAKSFKGLNSSLAQSTSELWMLQSGAKIVAQCMVSKYEYLIHRQ